MGPGAIGLSSPFFSWSQAVCCEFPLQISLFFTIVFHALLPLYILFIT